MDTVIYFLIHPDVINNSEFSDVLNKDNLSEKNIKRILSVSGEKSAEFLSKCGELKNIDSIYSSSYVRCLETAKYIALENNLTINIDERLNERKVGQLNDIEWSEFNRLQLKDFNFKLSGGESLNQTKKRMADSVKNILMFESGNRVVVVSHATSLTCLLSSWCEVGKNYIDQIILTYNDNAIIDGYYTYPMLFKVTFDGMNVTNVEYIENVK